MKIRNCANPGLRTANLSFEILAVARHLHTHSHFILTPSFFSLRPGGIRGAAFSCPSFHDVP